MTFYDSITIKMQRSRRGFLNNGIGSTAALGLPLSAAGKREEALRGIHACSPFLSYTGPMNRPDRQPVVR